MKKLFIIALALIMVLTTFAGCGQKADSTTSEPEEKAEASKTLTIYSPHEADIINLIVKEFQEQTGITVNSVAAGTGELLARVEAESANPQCDVFWGGGADSLSAFSKYFEKYTTSEIDGIDPKYVDANGYWTGESPLPMIIMYNKNLVAESDVPKSWNDLLDPKWKGKIAYADPNKSGSAYTILCTLLTAYGKDDGKGWEFVKAFVANLDGKLIGSSSAVYKGVADGEYSLGLTLEEQAVKYIKSGAPAGIIYPSEGTSAVPDGIAIIKGAQNMDNAKLFVDFVASKESQAILASELNRRPVRTDVDPPEGMTALKDLKLVDYDFAWASTQKEEILAKWKEVIVGQ